MQRKTDPHDRGLLSGKAASRRIVRLASGQHGVVSIEQLRDVSPEVLRTGLAAGWLVSLHRGVYGVAGQRTRRSVWMAAVLACGQGAVLSHQSAGGLWRVLDPEPGPSHVTVPTRAGREHQNGIVIHRPRRIHDEELSSRDGMPVTSPAKTILDLAATGLGQRRLERACDEAERLGLCGPDELRDVASVSRRRPGALRLRALLRRHEVGSTLTRSELEERFLRLCRERGFAAPLVNAEVLGLTVDFLWPRAGLVVEVDGRASHDTARAFQDDRDRDSLLSASGYVVLRFTWWDVTERPAVVTNRIGRVLAGRGGAGPEGAGG